MLQIRSVVIVDWFLVHMSKKRFQYSTFQCIWQSEMCVIHSKAFSKVQFFNKSDPSDIIHYKFDELLLKWQKWKIHWRKHEFPITKWMIQFLCIQDTISIWRSIIEWFTVHQRSKNKKHILLHTVYSMNAMYLCERVYVCKCASVCAIHLMYLWMYVLLAG